MTVEQITEAADVSAMTFYRHFGSKEAVVISVATTDQMNRTIDALDRIRIPGEIPDVLDDFFADAASGEAELAERVALVRANQTLVNARWQRSTFIRTAVSDLIISPIRGPRVLPEPLSQLEYGARDCAVSLRFNDLRTRPCGVCVHGNRPRRDAVPNGRRAIGISVKMA